MIVDFIIAYPGPFANQFLFPGAKMRKLPMGRPSTASGI